MKNNVDILLKRNIFLNVRLRKKSEVKSSNVDGLQY